MFYSFRMSVHRTSEIYCIKIHILLIVCSMSNVLLVPWFRMQHLISPQSTCHYYTGRLRLSFIFSGMKGLIYPAIADDSHDISCLFCSKKKLFQNVVFCIVSRVPTDLGKSLTLTLVLDNSWNLKKVPFILELSWNFVKSSLISH